MQDGLLRKGKECIGHVVHEHMLPCGEMIWHRSPFTNITTSKMLSQIYGYYLFMPRLVGDFFLIAVEPCILTLL